MSRTIDTTIQMNACARKGGAIRAALKIALFFLLDFISHAFPKAGDFTLLAIRAQHDNVLRNLRQADLPGDHRQHIHSGGHELNNPWKITVAGMTLGTHHVGAAHL